jgi:predicted transposase/invertase (TIGR01784 family)
MKFADPKNDIAFKKIFGDENHKNILISFLNAILDFKGNKEIVDVELLNPYQVPKIEELKETILDIRAKNKNNETFIVEMQKKDLSYFAKRSLYYTSKAYVSQLSKGSEYESLKKVYFIGILNFTMFSNKDYVSRHLILNKETLKQEIDDFEFSFIELPKFNKQLNELNTILDKWIYFIKEAQNLDFIPKEFEDKKEFLEAFKIATQYTWNQEELDIYDYIAIKEYDEINAMETAKKKAREEGLKEGREEGLKEGEKKAKIEIAKNLLKAGVDIDTIVISTGLDKKVIEELVSRD